MLKRGCRRGCVRSDCQLQQLVAARLSHIQSGKTAQLLDIVQEFVAFCFGSRPQNSATNRKSPFPDTVPGLHHKKPAEVRLDKKDVIMKLKEWVSKRKSEWAYKKMRKIKGEYRIRRGYKSNITVLTFDLSHFLVRSLAFSFWHSFFQSHNHVLLVKTNLCCCLWCSPATVSGN